MTMSIYLKTMVNELPNISLQFISVTFVHLKSYCVEPCEQFRLNIFITIITF